MDEKEKTLSEPLQITCAYHKDGKEKTTICEVSGYFNPRDPICDACRACRR